MTASCSGAKTEDRKEEKKLVKSSQIYTISGFILSQQTANQVRNRTTDLCKIYIILGIFLFFFLLSLPTHGDFAFDDVRYYDVALDRFLE